MALFKSETSQPQIRALEAYGLPELSGFAETARALNEITE